jgi:general secretion pathway protein H
LGIGSSVDVRRQDGFVLLEVVCVLAIIGLLIAIILPQIPRSTSRTMLEAYALETAALLKADRYAAIRRGNAVAAQVDVPARTIRSGSSGLQVRLPDDVRLDAILAERCGDRPAYARIMFFQSGMSCGGVLAISRPGAGYQVRVNWLTGSVEVVANAQR